jgi:hypothetical protein
MAIFILHELRDDFGAILLFHSAIKSSVGNTSFSKSNFTHCIDVKMCGLHSAYTDLRSKLALNNANTTAFSTLRGLGMSKSSAFPASTLVFAADFSFEFCHKKCHGAVKPRAYLPKTFRADWGKDKSQTGPTVEES